MRVADTSLDSRLTEHLRLLRRDTRDVFRCMAERASSTDPGHVDHVSGEIPLSQSHPGSMAPSYSRRSRPLGGNARSDAAVVPQSRSVAGDTLSGLPRVLYWPILQAASDLTLRSRLVE